MVKIAVLKEQTEGEGRVAVTPDIVKKYISAGATIAVEAGCGHGSMIADSEYETAGATLERNPIQDADILLSVRPPESDALDKLKEGALLVGMLDPYGSMVDLTIYNHKNFLRLA